MLLHFCLKLHMRQVPPAESLAANLALVYFTRAPRIELTSLLMIFHLPIKPRMGQTATAHDLTTKSTLSNLIVTSRIVNASVDVILDLENESLLTWTLKQFQTKRTSPRRPVP